MKCAGFKEESEHQSQGKKFIVGLDEVGRGAWAGPLVAVAYRFFQVPTEILVGDSKKISEPKRNKLAEKLKSLGEWRIGEVIPHEIDLLGLQPAQFLAYDRALGSLFACDTLLLDGPPVAWRPQFPPHILTANAGRAPKVHFFIGGDAEVASIAAASIIAKVHRDFLMKTIAHNLHPNYGFSSHVGYGTQKHRAALQAYGVTNLHRMSYKPVMTLHHHSIR